MSTVTYTQAHKDAALEVSAASEAVINYLIETAPELYERLCKAHATIDRLDHILTTRDKKA